MSTDFGPILHWSKDLYSRGKKCCTYFWVEKKQNVNGKFIETLYYLRNKRPPVII